MKRIITQKLQNFSSLYEEKGPKTALKILMMKVFSYSVGSQRIQELAFNFINYKNHKNFKKKASFYENESSSLNETIKISIFLIIFDSNLPSLKQSIQSIQLQFFKNLEILCAFDQRKIDNKTQIYLNDLSTSDSRFKPYDFSANLQNKNYLNTLLDTSSGEFICIVNAGDKLSIDAFYEVARLLNGKPETDFIYSDDAQLMRGNWLTLPFFKPDWCPDNLLSRMYTGRLSILRRSLIQQIGGWRPEYSESQEYDLILRLTEQTNNIIHIPKVLYFWGQDNIISRGLRTYLKNRFQITETSAKAVEDTLVRQQEPGKVTIGESACFTIRYAIKDYHRVSIIIPTRDLWKILDRCLESIFSKSSYPDFEVILIDNGSQEEETFKVFEKWSQKEAERFRVFKYDIPFNYSKLNNYGVSQATGDYLLFLNNDIEVITDDWLEAMVEQAQRPSIGAVGALLLYPDGTIQHGGVVVGLGGAVGGAPGHAFVNLRHGEPGYFDQPNTITNYTALTAACLMCRRNIFEEVNGFEEKLAVAFNDTDFCLKIYAKGYRNIYLPHVKLYHYESKSRGREDTPEKKKRFTGEIEYLQNEWRYLIDHDPSYNPNLTNEKSDFSFNISKAFSNLSK